MDQIYKRTYHDFTIDKSFFSGGYIPTIVNEKRMTRSQLFEIQDKHPRTLLISL